jgi:hypothetical protein
MNLSELLAGLDRFDDEHTIYISVDREPCADSAVDVAEPPADDSVAFDGMHELMGVWHAREAFDGCRSLLSAAGSATDHAACVERFLEYLTHDA